jgi:hypothetical protein
VTITTAIVKMIIRAFIIMIKVMFIMIKIGVSLIRGFQRKSIGGDNASWSDFDMKIDKSGIH